MINNEAYLQRIFYDGPTSVSLQTVTQLQKAHVLHVPFENLDIHQKVPIELNIDHIYNKVINQHRGGFCYELNGLFYELLKCLGFEVRRISARVYHANEYAPEYDHLAIVATIDGKEYLTDVGFGEFTFSPLRLDTTELQHDERGTFRIDRYETFCYRVNKQEDNVWQSVYVFENRHREFREFEAMCRYHQTSPESPFTKSRLIKRPTCTGRITLTNDTLKISENGHPAEEKPVNGAEEFATYLDSYFGIR
ncbi:arylamine N-acetyltransferase family protein [Prolixibacter denitrificans]|jgi:N-hydroxyarylamine O-acetyltransferase|uniref:Acetyltransferase n=1 Tax=Prolixibacter denitrificans TaxID=1541063 RepID=A0A2P8C6B2_9BACT|nr:arylamine N-acetyltransferase [Prolixibacter denitrificans]PSK80494.1 N-hydroxyarylamine O-acetyltransferase [Prolixibacter denitrificans]GET22728.1 acetyltransferase [Prolixibacter denitrificans]